jgi:hypothetical protein
MIVDDHTPQRSDSYAEALHIGRGQLYLRLALSRCWVCGCLMA